MSVQSIIFCFVGGIVLTIILMLIGKNQQKKEADGETAKHQPAESSGELAKGFIAFIQIIVAIAAILYALKILYS